MELLAPAAAAAFVAVPVLLAVYVLKVRGSEVPVGGLFLWPAHVADRQANTPWKRLRPSWLLVVQLLVAAALALALMRPGLVGATGVASTTVVLLDGSPSMAATDVAPSRFGAAVEEVQQMAEQLGPDQQMAVVLLGEHASLLAPPTDDVGVLRDALSGARPSGQRANLEEGISVANAVLAGRPDASVVLFSDGRSRPPASAPRLSAPLTYRSIGQSGRNVALERVGRTPQGDVFLRAANLGPSAEDRRIELRVDGRLVDVVPVRVEPGSSVESVWPRLPAGTSVLEARLTPGDDLALDDAGWLVTAPPAARRVQVVTPGNGFLTRALALRPDLELTVVEPAQYRSGGTFDLYVFDRFVPDGALPSPALVIAPPEGTGPVTAGPSIDPGPLAPAGPAEPLLEYVSLRDVHVQSAVRVGPAPGWRTVISGANGPLLLVNQDEPRLAQLNFDVHHSDLPLRPAFPILVHNLVSHLLPEGFESQVVPLGQPVRLAAGPDVSAVEVATPAGRIVRLRPPFPASLEDTTTPGVYSVRETVGDEVVASRFVVQLQDPEHSRIALGEAPLVRATPALPGANSGGTLEVWPWLAALALVGLLVEWTVFLRG